MGLGILGLTTNLGVALVIVGVAVGAVLIMDIVVTTLVQRQVPDALRGRAMGLLQLTGVSVSLVGSLLAPALVPVIGLGAVLTGSGLLLAIAAVVAVAILASQGSLRAQTDIDPLRVELLRRTILVGAPAARLETAVRDMIEVAVNAGEVVIREGDPADRFYLIADGRFAVSQAAPDGSATHLRDLGPGDPFGEIGLLTGSVRTATVTALTDGRLLALERDRFLELVGPGPELRSGLLSLYQGGVGRLR
jgi:MFS family permease